MTMGSATAGRMVVLAGLVIGASVFMQSGDRFQRAYAGAVLVLILSFLADLVPSVAGPLALIAALSAGLTKGGILTWAAESFGGGASRAPVSAQSARVAILGR